MCIRPEYKNALIRWKKGLVEKEEGGKGRKIAVDGGQIHPEGNAGNVSTFIGICVQLLLLPWLSLPLSALD